MAPELDHGGHGGHGTRMSAEIDEQPAVWEHLLRVARDPRGPFDRLAESIRRYSPRFVLFIARGTSDHAALYGKYLTEITLGLPCGLASPSTTTAYGARPDLHGVLVVAVSQSGGSTDLVESVQVARSRGALTAALTNTATSPLADAAELHLDVGAGDELAVAATKSYTAQLLALYLLLDRVNGGSGQAAERLPDLGREVLSFEPRVAEASRRYTFATRLVTTARGYSYATAREAALKLMETCYVSAQAFSGADLMHGPLAMVDSQVPVIMVAAAGVGGGTMRDVIDRLSERSADVWCVGSRQAVIEAGAGVVLPAGLEEQLSPLVEILPLQQLAKHLSIAKGVDPDSPRALRKVTLTR